MKTSIRYAGEQPGTYEIMYFHAKDGAPCGKQDAVTAEVVTYKDDGTEIGRAYGTINAPEPAAAPAAQTHRVSGGKPVAQARRQ